MSTRRTQCSFCERINPPESKFCNACGAPLYLAPCAHCGAVNDAAATSCHQCKAPLPESTEEEGAPPLSSSGERSGAPAVSRPGSLQQPSQSSDGLDRDAEVLATLHELEELLARTESGLAAGKREGSAPDSQATRLQELQELLARTESGLPADKPKGSTPDSQVTRRAREAVRAGAVVQPYPVSIVPESPALHIALDRVPRRRAAVIVGTAVLAVITAAAFYAYRQRSTVDVPQTAAASGEARARSGPSAVTGSLVDQGTSSSGGSPTASIPGPAGSGAVGATIQPIAPTPGSSVATIRPDSVPAVDAPSPTTTRIAGSPGGTADQRRATVPPRDPGERAASAPPTPVRPRTADAGQGLDLPRPRLGPCTEAVAALGLCTPEPTQRRE